MLNYIMREPNLPRKFFSGTLKHDTHFPQSHPSHTNFVLLIKSGRLCLSCHSAKQNLLDDNNECFPKITLRSNSFFSRMLKRVKRYLEKV